MTKPAKFSPRYYLRPKNLPCDGIDSVKRYSAIWHWEPQFSATFAGTSLLCLLVFRQCPGIAIVQKYTAHITVKEAYFYLNAYVPEENLVHQVRDIFFIIHFILIWLHSSSNAYKYIRLIYAK